MILRKYICGLRKAGKVALEFAPKNMMIVASVSLWDVHSVEQTDYELFVVWWKGSGFSFSADFYAKRRELALARLL